MRWISKDKLDTGKHFGLTLVELMLGVIIVAVFAAVSMPRLIRATEATKGREAVAALQQIRHGEIGYRDENNTYWPAGSSESNVATINSTLRLFIDTRELNWDYSVTATANTFTATATRVSGAAPYKNKTITIDENWPPYGGNWPLPLP